jgi:hypothetical protein
MRSGPVVLPRLPAESDSRCGSLPWFILHFDNWYKASLHPNFTAIDEIHAADEKIF